MMRRGEAAIGLVRRAFCAGVVAALFSANRALAEEPPRPAPTPAHGDIASSSAHAKLRFEQGKAAYREGRYADAIQAFTEADALAPRAALSFDIARAYERLGDSSGAVEAYHEYLRRAPDAPNADLVRARIAELEPKIPAPAAIASEPATVVAAPPAAAPVTAHADTANGGAHASFAPWSWATLATGGALLASAGVLELVRRDAESDARQAPTQLAYADEYQRMRNYQSAARVLAGVGAALAVTGGVLVVIDLGRGRRAATRVACAPNGCWGRVEGSF